MVSLSGIKTTYLHDESKMYSIGSSVPYPYPSQTHSKHKSEKYDMTVRYWDILGPYWIRSISGICQHAAVYHKVVSLGLSI